MDHIFEHDGQPIPDLTQSGAGAPTTGTSSGAGAMDVDDDEDSEALRSALKLSKGEGSGAAEASGGAEAHANVSIRLTLPRGCLDHIHDYFVIITRASNAQSAGKYSAIRTRRTSMPSRAGTTNSKSQQKRCCALAPRLFTGSNPPFRV